MEAVALYTFRATEGDELSFNKGDMLKVRSHLHNLAFFVGFFFFCKKKRKRKKTCIGKSNSTQHWRTLHKIGRMIDT